MTPNPVCPPLCASPGAWGIESGDDPANTPWQTVLDGIQKAGYQGTELGPHGYLPDDSALLCDELASRGLRVVAGTLYDNLIDPSMFDSVLRKTRETCGLLRRISSAMDVAGEVYYVIIDSVKPARDRFAGNMAHAPRLDSRSRALLRDHIREIAMTAREQFDVTPVLHPHAGGSIEFGDEVAEVLDAIPEDSLGICFDIGHSFYAGGDPAEEIRRYGGRIRYVHCKDVDMAVYDAAIREGVGFYSACRDRVMVPLGQGSINYQAVCAALQKIGYGNGWVTVEQDRHAADSLGVVEALVESRNFLRKLLSEHTMLPTHSTGVRARAIQA